MNIPRKRRYPTRPLRPRGYANGGVIKPGVYMVGESGPLVVNVRAGDIGDGKAIIEAIRKAQP